MSRFATRAFGNRKRTRADKRAALESLLCMRVKPYSEADLEAVARTHGHTTDEVRTMLVDRGKGDLIQDRAWRGRLV